MTQMAENRENSTVSEMESCEEMRTFFKERKLLPTACEETGLDLDAARNSLKGDASKMKMMYAITLTRWVALWKSAEAERRALSGVVSGIVGK